MRLVFSTDRFVYAGKSRPGLPIILGDDMWPLQPVQEFIVYRLLGKGTSLSKLTWESYGRRLWDYFAFLRGHGIPWDCCLDPGVPGKGPVAQYRAWSLSEGNGKCRAQPSTINRRLRLVVEFYEWALENGYIHTLPFGYEERRIHHGDHWLVHTAALRATTQRPDAFVREWTSPPEFLSKEQIKACRACPTLRRPGPRLLFDLMWRVGLRSCEARTFPLKYVFDPAKRAECHPGKMIRIELNPRDMEIKLGKPRAVDLACSLMEDLYAYTLYERNRLASTSAHNHASLILNEYGRPYTKDAVAGLMRTVSKQIGHGFRVTALMLRHSYAVHTLAHLRASRYEGEPLLYVRDRLGHADVQTTTIYLDQINQLASQVVLAIEDEFDRLFESTIKA